jgi:hypothetical protein
MAEEEVDKCAKVAFRRRIAVLPQRLANPLKLLLVVAVEEGIPTLIRKLLLRTLRVPPLEGFDVLPDVVHSR